MSSPLECTDDEPGLAEEEERVEVAEQDPAQQDVAELPSYSKTSLRHPIKIFLQCSSTVGNSVAV
jgi:hypothetical protein